MTDPMTVIDPAHGREQEGLWTRRLVLFLRIVAGLSLFGDRTFGFLERHLW